MELLIKGKYDEQTMAHIIVKKCLISLSKKYDFTMIVIEESTNISSLSIQEYLDSLKSHEQILSILKNQLKLHFDLS